MKYRKFITSLCEGAGAIQMKYLHKAHRITVKKGAGIVTEADKGSEKFILKKIFRNYPNSSIITEESGEFQKDSDLCWIIDPLDGTSNYAHGFPWFCVSIGLQKDRKEIAGAVYNPVSREMFYAEAGKGAYLGNKRIRVSRTSQMQSALVGTGFYYSKGRELREEMEIFRAMNQLALGVRRPGAAALDLAHVACGRYDGFWERRLSSWDVAAGFLLVKEAGGSISNYNGKSTDVFEGSLIASNGHLHRRMVSVIKKAISR